MRDCWVSQIYQIFNNKLKRLHRFSRGVFGKEFARKTNPQITELKEKKNPCHLRNLRHRYLQV